MRKDQCPYEDSQCSHDKDRDAGIDQVSEMTILAHQGRSDILCAEE